ncbi:MAG: hypothetical protein ABI417_10240, partial [Coleofasciculaceae cyanobacterium]
MATPLESGQSANLPNEEITPPAEPLGIKDPLLSPIPLGQRFISPKFLSPLGARPLSTVDFSTFSDEAFWDSPFLNDSPPNVGSTPLATPLTRIESPENAVTSSTFIQPQLETLPSENTVTSSTFIQPQLETLPSENTVTSSIFSQPQLETLPSENTVTSSTFVQPQLETPPPESLTNTPRNLTTDSHELEATTSQENASSPLPIFKTEVSGKEIRVQKAEVPEVAKQAQPSVVDEKESPTISQPTITPESKPNLPATKSELSVQRSPASLPITESEAIVSGLDEIVQPHQRTQETVDLPSLQSREASSQVTPTHKNSTPESDRQIALTRDVPETFIPSELTENSTKADPLVQTKAASELAPNITSKLDQSASEKRQESTSNFLVTPDNSSTTQSNYTEVAIKDSLIQRSALPSEDDITRTESIDAVSELSTIAPTETTVVTVQGELLSKQSETPQKQHPVPPSSETSTFEQKANETTSSPQGETLVQRSHPPEIAQPTLPITSAIPGSKEMPGSVSKVESLVQRLKSRSEDSKSTKPVTSQVDESSASTEAIASSNITTIATQADQSFPAPRSGETLVPRKASSEVTAAAPVKSAGDTLPNSSSAFEEIVSALTAESPVQRQVAPPAVTQTSDSVPSVEQFTSESRVIPEANITLSSEITALATTTELPVQ